MFSHYDEKKHVLFWDTILNPSTMKPVCNDHLYDEIYYLWFMQ